MISDRRREFLVFSGSALATALWQREAMAESPEQFPSKPVRIAYPFAPGGGMDVVLRVLAQDMQKTTGQSFIVDNRAGAGGAIAAQSMASAAPDGYTIFVGPTGISSITPHLRKLPYDTRDFVPIARLSEFKALLAVANNVPATTVQEFIAYAKANPGAISFASSGVGSQGQLNGLMLEKSWGIQMTHVPYKGAADVVNDLLAGRVSMSSDVTMLQYVKSGQVRLLAVMSDKRLVDFPDAPAITELPVPRPNTEGTWFGAFAPKGTPDVVVEKIAAAFEKALTDPEALAKMRPFAMRPAFLGPKAFKSYWTEQYELYGRVVRDANIRLGD